MKKIYFLTLLILSFVQLQSSAQCIDTIGVNTPEIQNEFYILVGWGVNEFPNAVTWTRIRHCSSLYPWNLNPWIESIDVENPDSCTGWMIIHMIDTASLRPYEYLQFQVCMVTGGGDYYESEIVETKQRKTPAPTTSFRNLHSNWQTTILTGAPEFLDLAKLGSIKSEVSPSSLEDIKIINSSNNAISISNPSNQLFDLRIFDVTGREIAKQQVMSNQFELPIFQSQSTGIYIIEISSGFNRRTERIFIK